MQFRNILIIALMAFAVTLFGQGTLGADLQKALDNSRDGEQLPVVVILKEQFDVKGIAAQHSLQGEGRKFVCQMLQQKAQNSQRWLRSFVEGQRSDVVSKADFFWLVNGAGLVASPDAIRELANNPEVDYILLDKPQVMIDPIEVREAKTEAWGVKFIHADSVWGKGAKGDGIVVAIVDTGIDLDHPEFAQGQVLTELCTSFVDGEPTAEDGNGHGTHCAGTVGSPKYGVAPSAKLIGVKVLSSSGSGTWTGVTKGVEYAVQHADIISMSLGGRASQSKNSVDLAVEKAIAGGIICVIAAGNQGWGLNKIGSPGLTKEAITIGAIYENGYLTSFSSQGPTIRGDAKPDVVAPGANVPSLWKKGGYKSISGTSMATPHVAGLCALILSKKGSLSPQQVKDIIMNEENTFGSQ